MTDECRRVYIIDDDEDVRTSIGHLVTSIGLAPMEFANGEEFLTNFAEDGTACVIADVRMPRMNGLQLLKECNARGFSSPIILVTGYPEIEAAVDAMKAGAFDFIAKPFSAHRMVETLQNATLASAERRKSEHAKRAAKIAIEKLSVRERDVAQLLVEGLRTKDIARRLGLSHRTVEKHRRSIHCKTGVQSVAGLVHLFAPANQTFTTIRSG